MKLTDNNQFVNLLQYGVNYDRKIFYYFRYQITQKLVTADDSESKPVPNFIFIFKINKKLIFFATRKIGPHFENDRSKQ